jgi:hypothetical protein
MRQSLYNLPLRTAVKVLAKSCCSRSTIAEDPLEQSCGGPLAQPLNNGV